MTVTIAVLAAALGGAGAAFLLARRSLRAQRAQLAALRGQVGRDALTGLANRRAWEDELPRELARARRNGSPVSVVLADLDGFKAVNDRDGHQAGDRLLRHAAAAWRDCLREVDVIARFGGDEFGVVLPDCSEEAALRVAERLRRATPPGVTCSLGAAGWDRSETAAELFGRADRALYAAKRAGRDRVAPAAGHVPSVDLPRLAAPFPTAASALPLPS